jgi:hypothetical protein
MLDQHLLVYLFHVLVIGPLLVYTATRLTNTDKLLKATLMILGSGVTVYHAYKFFILYRLN